MRLMIVRHGDPDYENDTLTERGWEEAKLLVPRFQKLDVKNFYVSPLGRAKDTASCTLKAMNRTAVECDWLREFPAELLVENSEALQKGYPDTRKDENGFLPRCAIPERREQSVPAPVHALPAVLLFPHQRK